MQKVTISEFEIKGIEAPKILFKGNLARVVCHFKGHKFNHVSSLDFEVCGRCGCIRTVTEIQRALRDNSDTIKKMIRDGIKQSSRNLRK